MYKYIKFEDGTVGLLQCNEVTEEDAGILIIGGALFLLATGIELYDKITDKLDERKREKLKIAEEKIKSNPELKKLVNKVKSVESISDKLNFEIISNLKKIDISKFSTLKSVKFGAEKFTDYIDNQYDELTDIVSEGIAVSKNKNTLTIGIPDIDCEVECSNIDEYIDSGDESNFFKQTENVFKDVCKKYSNDEFEFSFSLWADGDHLGQIGFEYTTYMSVTIKNVDLSKF